VRTEITSIAGVIVAAVLAFASTTEAKVRYVAASGGGQDGLSWPTAYKSIQAAIDDSAVSDGDEIWVKAGVYVSSSTTQVTKAVKILGGFGGSGDTRDWTANTTTISGSDFLRCMMVTADAYIEGVTFSHGYMRLDDEQGRGGGLYIRDCGPTITHCVFSENAATRGGAIATQNAGRATITHCSFTSNTADAFGGAISNQESDLAISDCTFHANSANMQTDYLGGGGIFNEQSASRISGCVFTANAASGGAGICNYLADPIIENCSFSDSDASTYQGGGIMNCGGSATISRCVFRDNTAGKGGAIWDQSTSTIVNCIMWNNHCAQEGGAIYIASSDDTASAQPIITNCTLYGNYAPYGGGVRALAVTAILRNCIIWGNLANSGPGIYQTEQGLKLDVANCDVEGGSVYGGSGNIRFDPQFVNAGTGDFRLVLGSPCVDAGDNTATGLDLLDYVGNPRVVDGDGDHAGDVDLGPLEFHRGRIDERLYGVRLSQDTMYANPSDTAPTFRFSLIADTAATVAGIQFHSPGGYTYAITSAAHATPGAYQDTYHTVNGTNQTWEFLATFPSFPLLSDYGDGTYYVTIFYDDGTSQQTSFWYGAPDGQTVLDQPRQVPNITSPAYGGSVASPVVLTWDACTDASANKISVTIVNANGTEEVSELLAVTATRNNGVAASENLHHVQVAFQDHHEVTTPDDVPFLYGKAVVLNYEVDVSYSTIYRFWSPRYKQHFYTIKEGEKQKLIDHYASAWTYEGPVFSACVTPCHLGLAPVYRFWSRTSGAHFYTIKEGERDKLIDQYSQTWTYEGVAFYAYAPGTQPSEAKAIYRFWNASASAHFYTMSESERDKLINMPASPYAYEGIAFYGYPK
jgi:hypothetical protein